MCVEVNVTRMTLHECGEVIYHVVIRPINRSDQDKIRDAYTGNYWGQSRALMENQGESLN